MKDRSLSNLRTAAGAVLLALCMPAVAAAHGEGAFLDIYENVFVGTPFCNQCHSFPGDAQSGGFRPPTNEDAWYDALVGVKPSNGVAAGLGKLRVTPYEPWNSFLLDKLTGDLKLGEGRPMRFNTKGYVHECPGAIVKITRWILAGAPRVDDDSQGFVDCSASPPPFSISPSTTFPQAVVPKFTVTEPAREGESVVTVPVANTAADVLVDRIEVFASPGTEYVEVTRAATGTTPVDPAPLVVARGDHLDLQLPPGVAIRLVAGQQLTIRQRIRNDYWVLCGGGPECPSTYINRTDGEAAVNFYPTASSGELREATPFVDSTGTKAMFVPPRSAVQTGGAWISEARQGVNGLAIGVWADGRAIQASVADAASHTLATDQRVLPNLGDGILSGYVSITDPGLPIGALAYQCTHSNGFTNTNENADSIASLKGTTSLVNRPLKFACREMANPSPLLPSLAPGTPALLGPAPRDCVRSIDDTSPVFGNPKRYQDSECSDTPLNNCAAANLVGGDGVNDGRCNLIGLTW